MGRLSFTAGKSVMALCSGWVHNPVNFNYPSSVGKRLPLESMDLIVELLWAMQECSYDFFGSIVVA